MRTCLYRWVEEVVVILLVVVASEMVACGGRKLRRNGDGSRCQVAAASAIFVSSFVCDYG